MKFIPIAEPTLGSEEKKYLLKCLNSGWISSNGEFIQKFEKEFANFIGIKYAVSCSNGTAALHLGLKALDIGPNDEVIIPVLTFVASANVIKYVGATPIFVDIDPNTWNIDTSLIESRITDKTKAILVVHLYGYPSNMKVIRSLAKKYRLYIIEDVAEALGAKYCNKMTGTFSDVACFSFYGNKIITTGEGGMVVTNNKKIKDRISLYKNHGMSKKRKYFHTVIGYNYRLTNLQAAVGLAQLRKITKLLDKRRYIDAFYRRNLRSQKGIIFQPVMEGCEYVCWSFPFLINSQFKMTRNKLMMKLLKNGIETRPFFYPLTLFPMYKSKQQFNTASRITKQGMNLPSSANLNDDQLLYIVNNIAG